MNTQVKRDEFAVTVVEELVEVEPVTGRVERHVRETHVYRGEVVAFGRERSGVREVRHSRAALLLLPLKQ